MLADDHALMREGIKHLLEFDGIVEVIAEANDGVECLEKLKTIKPDLLLLDINMPVMNGLDVLEELKRKKSGKGINAYCPWWGWIFNACSRYRCRRIYLKRLRIFKLKQAIDVILNGDSYIQPSLLPALNSRLINRDTDKDKLKSLTRRELEILKQIAGGMFNKEIATNLNISERTVKNHISNIFKKIDVSDRTQAAVFAIRNNVVRLY